MLCFLKRRSGAGSTETDFFLALYRINGYPFLSYKRGYTMNEEQIRNLEMKVTYLENTLHELSDEIFKQSKTIAAMKKEIERLGGLDSDEEIRENEKPPHY